MIVEYWIVDRYKRGKRDGLKEGETGEEGGLEGETGERSRWRAWYERMQAAQREGRPFDEPPPGEEKDGKAK